MRVIGLIPVRLPEIKKPSMNMRYADKPARHNVFNSFAAFGW
jgi:hypothetical protein